MRLGNSKKILLVSDSYGYFKSEREGEAFRLHRLILKTNKIIDHINGDRGDNRRENLRECTEAENALNKGTSDKNVSGYPGVYYHKVNKKWVAYLNYKRKRVNLGSYNAKAEAIKVRQEAEIKYYKGFRRENAVKY